MVGGGGLAACSEGADVDDGSFELAVGDVFGHGVGGWGELGGDGAGGGALLHLRNAFTLKSRNKKTKRNFIHSTSFHLNITYSLL